MKLERGDSVNFVNFDNKVSTLKGKITGTYSKHFGVYRYRVEWETGLISTYKKIDLHLLCKKDEICSKCKRRLKCLIEGQYEKKI